MKSKGSCTEAEAELARLVEACEPVVISEARKRQSLGAVYSRHHERRRSVRFGLRTAMAAACFWWLARRPPPSSAAAG